MKVRTFLAAIGALMMLGTLPAMAGQCGYDYCYGAVAYNPNTGSYGWSHSHWSETDAANAAQEGCGYNCTEVKTFYNTCGAVALGANGGAGWGFGFPRQAAQNQALSYCNGVDYGCRVLVWACSP